jgi:hypothetical protein
MKRLLAEVAVLGCLVSPAYAAGPTTWQGDLFITAVNNAAKCSAVNMNVGDFARGVFRPKSVSGNGPSDLLAWYFSRSAGQVVPTSPGGGTLDGATAATVRIIYGSAGFNQFTGVTLTGVDVNPPAPTGATATVAIEITIANVYSSSPSTPSGCNITLKGTLAKKP